MSSVNIATAQTITLVENDESVPVQLSEVGRSLFDRHNRIWRSNLRLNREPFAYVDGQLSARDVTGFVNLGGLVIEVAPKFLSPLNEGQGQWRRSLWAILARVHRTPILGSLTPGQVTTASQLPDLLGMVLLSSIRAGKSNGRPMGYVASQGRLGHLQGRFDTERLMDLVIYPGQIPCEYDVYSENVPANRLLRWAAEQLASQVRSVQLGHDLLEEAMAIDAVSAFPPSLAEAERINLAPHHGSLQPAVTVGQLLLTGRGLQHGIGGHELPGFLWKSAEVFERFVRYLMQTVARTRLPGVRVAGERIRLADPAVQDVGPLWTVPDIRLEQVGRTIGVLDAKYKVWQSQPTASDTYQVVTGAWTRNCRIAALIYPSPAAMSKDPLLWRLLGPGNPSELWALFLNLVEMGDPYGERALVERLATDLAMIIP